jgi:hypothetical protein
MDKKWKNVLIGGAVILGIGLVLTAVGWLFGGNQPIHINKGGISVGDGERRNGQSEVLSEELQGFSSISTDLSCYPVELIPSDRYAIEAVYDTGLGKPEYRIENDTLIVKDKSAINIGINLSGLINNSDKLVVKIYYPKSAQLKKVVIKEDASDLSFQELNAESAEFYLDLGKLELDAISADNIKVELGSGDCLMTNIQASNMTVKNNLGETSLETGNLKTLEIDAASGDVTVADVTAESGVFSLDLGKFKAEKLSTNSLNVDNQSGDIELSGKLLGKTEVDCSMGEVTVLPENTKDQYDYELKTNMGTVTVDGNEVSNSTSVTNGANNHLKVNAEMGDIKVDFK